MRWITLSILSTLLSVSVFQAQTPTEPTPAQTELDPTLLGQEWVDRINTLDDWRLTMDGSEQGLDEVVDGFLELLAPDVLVEVPQHDENQIGPVMLIGTEQVRLWALKFARSHVTVVYSLKRQTAGEVEGERMVYSKQLPWGGLGVSFPIYLDYRARADRRRFWEVGAVFLEYGENGKIQRFRIFQTEKEEVVEE